MTERDDRTIIAGLERWARRTEEAIAPFDPERAIAAHPGTPHRPNRRLALAVAASALVVVAAAIVWRVTGDGEPQDVLTAAQPTVAETAAASVPSAPSSSPSPSGPRVSFTATRPVADEPTCTVSACRYVDVTLEGFPPRTTIAVTCHSDQTGPFGFSEVTTDDNGNATGVACFFGYPGAQFHVSAGAVTSPTVTWPP